MAESVDVRPTVPRLAKGWSWFRSNLEIDSPESYYKKSLAIPFVNDINSQLHDQLKDRNHIYIFALLPSVMASDKYNVNGAREVLYQCYKSEMTNESVDFRSKVTG